MKTAILKRKAFRVGVALTMLASLILTLLLPAHSFAQGAVPATTTLDTGVANEVSANVNATAPSLAPATAIPATTTAPEATTTMYPSASPIPTAAAASGDTMQAKPNLETKLMIQNLSKNADATLTDNAPGDVLHVTATIKNLGPTDLTNYAATILAEKLFVLGSVINPGDGGIVKEQKKIEFPPISQAKDCNCTAKFEFTVKLNENICTEQAALLEGGLTVSIEDQLKKVNVICSAPVNPTPTLTAITEEEKVAPQTTKTGPEMLFFVALAGVLGYVMWRRKAEVTE